LAVAEAMHMAPEDGGPLQEDLVRVGWHLWDAWLAQIGVLQPQALELRGPEREVRRVGFAIADTGVESLRIVEEEPGIEAAAQPCREVGVCSPGIVALEICGWWLSRISRKTTNGPVFAIDGYFSTPDETAVAGLAEGNITVCNVNTGQITLLVLVDLDPGRIRKGRAYIKTVGVTQANKGRGTPQVDEFAEVARYVVADTLILRPDLVVHASRQIHVLLYR